MAGKLQIIIDVIGDFLKPTVSLNDALNYDLLDGNLCVQRHCYRKIAPI